MKACIFGPNGYLGQALAQALRARGDEVQLVSSRTGDIDPETGVLAPGVEIAPGTEVVWYLSQSPRYRQMPDAAAHLMSVNCVTAVEAAARAARAGVKRFFYASTGNVYAPSFAPFTESSPLRRDVWYSLSKVMAEDALALWRDRLEVTVLRIFGIYGPGQADKLVPNLVSSVRAGKTVFAERNPLDASDRGGLRFTPVYIDDAVRMLLQLATGPTAPVLNFAAPEVVSVRDIATAVAEHLRKPANVEIAERARASDLVADVSALQGLLAPRFTPFAEGLRKVLEASA